MNSESIQNLNDFFHSNSKDKQKILYVYLKSFQHVQTLDEMKNKFSFLFICVQQESVREILIQKYNIFPIFSKALKYSDEQLTQKIINTFVYLCFYCHTMIHPENLSCLCYRLLIKLKEVKDPLTQANYVKNIYAGLRILFRLNSIFPRDEFIPLFDRDLWLLPNDNKENILKCLLNTPTHLYISLYPKILCCMDKSGSLELVYRIIKENPKEMFNSYVCKQIQAYPPLWDKIDLTEKIFQIVSQDS